MARRFDSPPSPCRCAGAVADQRDSIAESFFDDPVGQLDRDVEISGYLNSGRRAAVPAIASTAEDFAA